MKKLFAYTIIVFLIVSCQDKQLEVPDSGKYLEAFYGTYRGTWHRESSSGAGAGSSISSTDTSYYTEISVMKGSCDSCVKMTDPYGSFDYKISGNGVCDQSTPGYDWSQIRFIKDSLMISKGWNASTSYNNTSFSGKK